MSDGPQGEGWWQASDGKWYPPAQAPGGDATSPGVAMPAEAPTAPPPGPADGGLPPATSATGTSGGGGGKAVLIGVVGLVLGLLVGGGVGWAVGGSDDGGGDDWSAFCDRAEELEAMEADGAAEPSEAESMAILAELVALAPEGYDDKLQPLVDLMGEEGGSTDDMDVFGEVFGTAMFFAGVLEVECGIVDDSGMSFGADMGGDMSFDGEMSLDDDFGTDGDSSFDDDFGTDGDSSFDDDFGTDDEGPPEPMSIDHLQTWLEDGYAGEAWLDAIAGWGISNEEDVSVYPSGTNLTDDEALAACAAISEYVQMYAPEGVVTVETSDNEPQASSDAGSDCELVGDATADATTPG